MKCEFSETQFVFGVLHELINKHFTTKKAWGMPMFPTLPEEYRLGFDTSIKGPVVTVFFQFKVPRKLTRSNSKYWINHNQEYYEIEIWPNSLTNQHNLLINLANKDIHNKVYYCSPGFIKLKDFTDHYIKEDIANNSIFIPCKSLPQNIGNDQHSISYTMTKPRQVIYHSKPKQIESDIGLNTFLNAVSESKPYDNIEHCLESISTVLEINKRDYNTNSEKFNEISKILTRKNISMILLSN